MGDMGWWKKTPNCPCQPGWSSGAAPTAAREMGQWDTALGKHPRGTGDHPQRDHAQGDHQHSAGCLEEGVCRQDAKRTHTKAVSLSPN